MQKKKLGRFFLLFTASVWSRPPGPPAVPGVFIYLSTDSFKPPHLPARTRDFQKKLSEQKQRESGHFQFFNGKPLQFIVNTPGSRLYDQTLAVKSRKNALNSFLLAVSPKLVKSNERRRKKKERANVSNNNAPNNNNNIYTYRCL